MIRFIWRNWWRHKERFILLLVGALIISSGLSYLLSLSETSKGTIVDALRKNWKAQYHILVRPPESRSVTESEDLLSPNYLSGLSGGISVNQWDEIKDMSDVSVAAPVAVIGYASYNVIFDEIDPKRLSPQGIYRLNTVIINHNGFRTIKFQGPTMYITKNSTLLANSDYHFFPLKASALRGFGDLLLVGIDPEQEAKLVGLDQAVLPLKNSRYFSMKESCPLKFSKNRICFPVLLSNHIYYNTTFQYTLERLKFPFEIKNKQTSEKAASLIREKGVEFLKQTNSRIINDYKIDSYRVYHKLIDGLIKGQQSQKESNNPKSKQIHLGSTLSKSGPVNYQPVTSPFPKQWEFAYKVKPNTYELGGRYKYGYRLVKPLNLHSSDKKFIHPYFIGTFDPGELDIAQNPLTKLPMQTYRPPTAKLVLDGEGNPVNPPVKIRPKDIPTSFLLEPPSMLTTIKAASKVLGDKPISAIRVKVNGVHKLTEKSQQKLEAVAKEIENKTGLITDITLGSSPQPALIHVPASGDIPELGWVQMPWVKLGTSFTIFQQTKLGFSGIIASVMLVAMAFVFATNLVSFLARRKEFAVLLATGWRSSQLVKLVFSESLLIGLFVAIVAWGIEGFYFFQHPDALSVTRVVIVGFLGLLIYLLGAIGPAVLASRISPYEAMRTGEIRKMARRTGRSAGMIGMSMNHLFGKFGRNILSIFAMVFPTMLLALFLFVSTHLKGILYTTWLGQYTALQVGTSNYIAMGIALVIAVLTTAEIMWQNVVERKPEIALLKAVGWRNGKVRLLVILEGIWTGIIAGIVSVLFGFGIIMLMYHNFPVDSGELILATGLIPVVVAVLGCILPAEIAVHIRPSLGMKERQ